MAKGLQDAAISGDDARAMLHVLHSTPLPENKKNG
jgi:hypothetical protein